MDWPNLPARCVVLCAPASRLTDLKTPLLAIGYSVIMTCQCTLLGCDHLRCLPLIADASSVLLVISLANMIANSGNIVSSS